MHSPVSLRVSQKVAKGKVYMPDMQDICLMMNSSYHQIERINSDALKSAGEESICRLVKVIPRENIRNQVSRFLSGQIQAQLMMIRI
ncbi:hypothetical protein FGO68_gene9380 [Halteria grandinella]|uniref:Uncharacterized protein n=1 Tax=Halteria grandinella TaxID=5974 RepID=A0A8J8NMV7_HALGN|nr:hypothetical protein FGO68_gene9380 [Halteria grandinella]